MLLEGHRSSIRRCIRYPYIGDFLGQASDWHVEMVIEQRFEEYKMDRKLFMLGNRLLSSGLYYQTSRLLV